MAADHMCPGDRVKWLARQREEAASFANRTSDAIHRTVVPTCWRCGSPDVYETERFVPRRPVCADCAWELISSALFHAESERAWLAVDLDGGRD